MTDNVKQFLKEVLVIDTETTGLLDKEDSEIIEIAREPPPPTVTLAQVVKEPI